MKLKFFKSLLFFLIISPYMFSQNTTEKLNKTITSYFEMDRENIHLHFNKEVYLTNEPIWFKGYVMDQKTKKLNYNTTNVFVALYNEDRKEISNGLYYAFNGTVLGSINLNKDLESGYYYIRTYTNYMNNFIEDESTLQKIKIINHKQLVKNQDKIDGSLEVSFAFEGGKFLVNTENNIIVNVKNCLNRGVILNDVTVLDDKNNIISTFTTNSQGYGKFTILKTLPINYKIKIDNPTFNKEVILPRPAVEGINIHANNFSLADKTIIKLVTNEFSSKTLDENYTLIISRNNESVFVPITKANVLAKDLILPKSNLFEGVNMLYLIDSKNNLISERILYHDFTNKTVIKPLNVTRIGDSLILKGNVSGKIANLSFSVLPKNTHSNFNKSNIQNNLIFNNYLENHIENSNYYFENFDRKKQYELDLFLSSNKSKYELKSILNSKPLNDYSFDIGVTISGKLNQDIAEKQGMKLKVFTYMGVNESISLTNNEFEFKNILAIDSTRFHFSLIDDKNRIKTLNLFASVKDGKKMFMKPLNINKTICQVTSDFNEEDRYELTLSQNTILLDSLNLNAVAKEKMNYNNRLGNSQAKGFKISDNDVLTFFDIFSFIQNNGYDVTRTGGDVIITSRRSNSFKGSLSPLIYVDDSPIPDFNFLNTIYLRDVDEIYINKSGYGGGTNAQNGVIKIYMKKTYGTSINNVTKIKSKEFLTKNGFEKISDFKTLKYSDYFSEAFENHGVIYWIPNIYTDDNGNFEIKVPHFYQNQLHVNIQGIDNYGYPIYFDSDIITK